MRRLALAACLFLLAVSPCLAAGSFDDLRATHPEIDQVIGRLPSSGIQASLRHVSQLLDQNRVADLGTAESWRLPAGFDRQMGGTLDRLDRDLQRGMPSLDLTDRMVLVQLVNAVAFRRLVDLYSDYVPCMTTEPCPGATEPAVLAALDRIAEHMAESIRQGLADWQVQTGDDLSVAIGAASAPPTARTFDDWTHDVVFATTIRGVEWIDY